MSEVETTLAIGHPHPRFQGATTHVSSVMPRYFFTFAMERSSTRTTKVTSYPMAAREWALLNARSSLNDESMSVRKWLGLIYEDDRVVVVMPFGAAIDTEMPR
jgi:hypothetical protein